MLQLRRPNDVDREREVLIAVAAAPHDISPGRPTVTEETIGWGVKRFDRARNALTRFEQFNLPGTVLAPPSVVTTGRRVVIFARRLGMWTAAPVEVAEFDIAERSITYTLRTLAGHPLAGEETFTVSREANGIVKFRITAISRPSSTWARLATPVIRLIQRRYRRKAIEHMRNATGVARSSVAR